jgi:hypothetical protein
MRSNAGMANREGEVDLRFAQFSAHPQLALWFGLADLVIPYTYPPMTMGQTVFRNVGI